MNEALITINKKPFNHLIYHFTLTYSNWETGKPCASESFESLSDGFQYALWKLSGVPEEHLTDRFTAAVNNLHDKKEVIILGCHNYHLEIGTATGSFY